LNPTSAMAMSGNVASVTNPQNFVTRFSYGNGACPGCGDSRMTALTDPKGNSWTFGYDHYGRLTDSGNYQLCSDQVSTVRRSLNSTQKRRPFDAQWTFEDYPVHWNFHMKLRVKSSDPNDPVIILDPWWRLWW